MSSHEMTSVQALGDLNSKLALELVFAEPGKDIGLLPTNHFVTEMDELCQVGMVPEPIKASVRTARQWVDKVLDGEGLFTAEILKDLGNWTTWMSNAVEAAQQDRPLPSLPNPSSVPSVAADSPTVASSAGAAPHPETKGILPLEMNVDRDRDLLLEFCHESHEHLQNIENGVLVLEANPSDSDTLNSIFRAYHTFKGGSGFLNLAPINRLAHELESLLDLARQGKLVVTLNITNIILAGGDTLGQFISSMEAQLSGNVPIAPILIPIEPLIEQIHVAIQEKDLVPSIASKAPAAPTETAAPAASVSLSPEPPAVPASTPALASTPPAGAKKPEAAAKQTQQALVVKVDTQKLDSLMDLVGELVIAQSLVAQDSALKEIRSPVLTRNLAQLGRITNDLQRNAMSLRLVPIRATFQKMNRLVRDLANAQGKKVDLLVEGEETELDRTIIEEINDPLIHMIRNSVDHGIEKPEKREAAGKPSKGTVYLKAYHQAGAVVIEIQDDGGGLNKDRILAKAIEQGLVKQSEQLEEREIYRLIFAPGFSTAEKVTEISGRGVGMDVVRRNIEKLRGKIEIQSVLGKGSTFCIFLPLTLAIIDGLIFGVGQHRFILPTLSVRESFQPRAGMITFVQGRGEVVNVRGKLCPMLRLHQYLNVPPKSEDPTQGILMVVEAGHETRCVLVDHLLGKQEVVIKSLGETFKHNVALAGATILGDGKVGLILDPNALVKLKSMGLAQAT